MKKHTPHIFAALLLVLAFLFVSCDPNAGTSSTWKFTNSASGLDYIEVTIDNGGSPSSFTLYYGQSQSVTWEDEGNDYFGGAHYTGHWSKSYVKGFHSTKYESLKEIVFYGDY